jgi:tubulin polyglutamylase TTLL6/13
VRKVAKKMMKWRLKYY